MLNTLNVEIRTLPARRVACIAYYAKADQGSMHQEIGARFQRLKDWLGPTGYDPARQLTIGAIYTENGRMTVYDCCIEVGEAVQSGSEEVEIKELPGGRYAVLSIAKEPAIIGAAIGRFYQGWLPENQIEIDSARQAFEIYFVTTMEYCVPVK